MMDNARKIPFGGDGGTGKIDRDWILIIINVIALLL